MHNFTNLRNLLMKQLELSEIETDLFLSLIKVEKLSVANLQHITSVPLENARYNAKKLEQKGMVIEINENEFRALHPRFAIVNRYRRICEEKGIPFKKNLEVDRLGIMLENYQEIKKDNKDVMPK